MSPIQDHLAAMKDLFDLEKQPVEEIRREADAASEKTALLPGTRIDKAIVAGLPAEWVWAANASAGQRQVVLYFHGGGFFAGSCATHRSLAARISAASGVPVLLVEYRLAPENKYPAANGDALAAYHWLIDNGFAAENIVVGGDSAGGCLTLMTLLTLRDAGDRLPAAAFTLTMWGDLINLDGSSYVSRAALDPIQTLKCTEIAASYYIGRQTVPSGQLSPIRRDLRGLPPLLIQAAGHDILLSDSLRLAERAKAAGVDATLEVWAEMWHVFHFYAGVVPEAQEALDSIGAFIRKHLPNVDRP